MIRRGVGLALLAVALFAARLEAQSVLAAGGLGVPIEAVDARGRALGSVGPGLFGTGLVPGDPVSAVDLIVPTLAFSLQSSWLAVDQAGVLSNQSTARFPTMGFAYPVPRLGILSVTYGSVLDQRWQFESTRAIPLAAGGVSDVTDRFVSDGGVAAARLGFARRLSPNLGVGVGVGRYTGSVQRRFTRNFDSLGLNVEVAPFQTGGRWGYSGLLADLGVTFDLPEVLRASVGLEWSTALDAEPDSATGGDAQSYDLPLQLRAGVSARLAPGLSAVASASYADWTGTDDDLTGSTTSGGAMTVGAGVEWDRAALFGRTLPIRFGWRRAELPFRLGTLDPVETTYSGGLGIVLARGGALPLAAMDASIERGSRSGGTIAEDFWRSTLSFRVSGF